MGLLLRVVIYKSTLSQDSALNSIDTGLPPSQAHVCHDGARLGDVPRVDPSSRHILAWGRQHSGPH